MPKTLTSWKEIAVYVGKGVRTVQRWERLIGLPVRRPTDHVRGVVLALPEELDAWMRLTTHCAYESSASEAATLRRLLSEALAENETLRRELQTLGQDGGQAREVKTQDRAHS
jgi:hypothetical protein